MCTRRQCQTTSSAVIGRAGMVFAARWHAVRTFGRRAALVIACQVQDAAASSGGGKIASSKKVIIGGLLGPRPGNPYVRRRRSSGAGCRSRQRSNEPAAVRARKRPTGTLQPCSRKHRSHRSPGITKQDRRPIIHILISDFHNL